LLTTSDKSKWQLFLERLRSLPEQAKPRINSGHLWLDCAFILLILALQETILPQLFWGLRLVDLITPWVLVNIVVQSYWPATIIALFAGVAQESHSAYPAGTYMAAYWIIANVCSYLKPTLSWRHTVPWLVAIFLANLWVRLFEFFIVAVTRGSMVLEGPMIASAISMMFFSSVFGLYLARNHKLDLDETDRRL